MNHLVQTFEFRKVTTMLCLEIKTITERPAQEKVIVKKAWVNLVEEQEEVAVSQVKNIGAPNPGRSPGINEESQSPESFPRSHRRDVDF